MLIGTIGATNVLWIDAGTYLVSFAVVLALVPQRAPTPPAEEAKGVLAGVRFLFRDRLLAPTALTSFLFGFFFPVLMATLPVLAYRRYDQDARIAGWLVAASRRRVADRVDRGLPAGDEGRSVQTRTRDDGAARPGLLDPRFRDCPPRAWLR